MFDQKDLAFKKTVPEMVVAYNGAKDKIEQAYKLLEDARNQLDNAFGKENYSGFETLSRYHASDRAEENIKYIMDGIKKAAWRNIINLLGIKKLLSIKRADEFDKKMQDGKDLPEISDATIYDMMMALSEQSKEYAIEAVKEVFDYLRPGKNESNKLKTNKKNARFELGEKVILSNVITHGWYGNGKHNVSQYRTNELTAIDRVFALLDGQPMTDNYKSPLIDAINTSLDGKGETAYFKFIAHKNGNLHLTFKRLDLITRMNQLAGNPAELRGKTAKEARKWVDTYVLLHVIQNELKTELQSILYHQEFWPDVDKTYHSFLSCGFKKGSNNSELIFVTGKVTKEGSIYDVFEINTVKENYSIWKNDIEKYWNIEVNNFIVG